MQILITRGGGFLGARPSARRGGAEVSRFAAENSGPARHLRFVDQSRLLELPCRDVDAQPRRDAVAQRPGAGDAAGLA